MSGLAAISPSAWATGVARHFELYGAKTAEDLVKMQAWGFDQVILESNELIGHANQLGLRVVQANWWNPTTEATVIHRQMERAVSADHLVSVNMMDEPIYNDPRVHPPEYYVQLRAELAPYQVPLSLTQYGPKEEWSQAEVDLFVAYLHAVDVMRIDPYPVVSGRPLRAVYDWAQRTQQMIRDHVGRPIPLTVVLQAWADGDDDSGRPKLPTPDQLRVMMYLAFFSGADTVSFYNYDLAVWDRAPGFQSALLAFVRELTALRRHLEELEVERGFESQDIFRVLGRAKSGVQLYCLQINTSSQHSAGLAPYGFRSCL